MSKELKKGDKVIYRRYNKDILGIVKNYLSSMYYPVRFMLDNNQIRASFTAEGKYAYGDKDISLFHAPEETKKPLPLPIMTEPGYTFGKDMQGAEISGVYITEPCNHDWHETIGIFSVWRDCKKCGIKGEDV